MRIKSRSLLILLILVAILMSCRDEDFINDLQKSRAGEGKTHEEQEDYIWDSTMVAHISLDGTSISVDSAGALTIDGSILTITSAGTFNIRGTLDDGQIVVDAAQEGTVRLILDGVDISNSASAPIYVIQAGKCIIVLAEGTENYLTDGTSYENQDGNEPNAAIFSKADLTLCGRGSLTVDANYNDGITSKDGLIISGCRISITAVDDGIRGRDYLVINDGTVTVDAAGDGFKSDNDEDEAWGYITINTAVIDISAGRDAIEACTNVSISDGTYNLSSGQEYNTRLSGVSGKGIKADVTLLIEGGTFTINSADDAIHSNGDLEIDGGTFYLSSGDDGIHADFAVIINGGEISIEQSYEGIESAEDDIIINGGTIHMVSSDDGINLAGGGDVFGMGGPPHGGAPPSSGDYCLYLKGGCIVIDAYGDGIDANGSIVMTGGELLINGPTANNNGALDFSSFKLDDGFLVAAGSAGMAQSPGTSSAQNSVHIYFRSMQNAGTLLHIKNGEGTGILTFRPAKAFQSVVFSSPELVMGDSYDVCLGGSTTGTNVDGLYRDGTYTPGTLYASFTVSRTVTTISR